MYILSIAKKSLLTHVYFLQLLCEKPLWVGIIAPKTKLQPLSGDGSPMQGIVTGGVGNAWRGQKRQKKTKTLNETLRIRKLEHLIMIMRLLAHFALDYKVASSKTSYILKNLRESCILKGSTIPLE